MGDPLVGFDERDVKTDYCNASGAPADEKGGEQICRAYATSQLYLGQPVLGTSRRRSSVVVGAVGKHGSSSGSAYVFTRSGTAWTETAKFTASDAAEGDNFGTGVSVSGET